MQNICYNCFHYTTESGPCPYCGYDARSDAGKYAVALKPGTLLANRYMVGRVLGQGGFGVTYVALDSQTRTRVAVKEYLPTEFVIRAQDGVSLTLISTDHEAAYEYGKQQFIAEARTLSQFIGNEHIIGIHAMFEANSTAYFAMEYVEGVNLKKFMEQNGGPLPVHVANRILMPIMEALDWVHSKGVVHRDIAPDNIMIRSDGQSKLIDFGAARYSTGEKSKSLDVILKHGFAPYEQYSRRGRQGPFTDVYAMAATYYYAITGRVPPDAVDRMDEDTIQRPSTLGVRIRRETEDVLLKALAVSSKNRYQTMAEFYRAMLSSMPQPFVAEAEGKDKKQQEPVKPLIKENPVQPATVPTPSMPVSEVKATPESKPASQKNEQVPYALGNQIEGEPTQKSKVPVSEKPLPKQGSITKQALTTPKSNEKLQKPQGKKLTNKKSGTIGKIAGVILRLIVVAIVLYILMTKLIIPEANYRNTIAVAKSGNDIEAYERFLVLGKYRDSAERAREIYEQYNADERLKAAEVGDIIFFGSYEQDNDLSNGKEPVEWYVLAKENNRILVISKFALDCKEYYTEFAPVTWEVSSLRNWLNSTFLSNTFDEEELAMIPSVIVSADKNPDYNTNPGNSTMDQVFLLSISEFNKYFEHLREPRECAPTAYAVSQGCRVSPYNEKCFWLLRTPGQSSNYVARINNGGSVHSEGFTVDYKEPVRPALWISTDAVNSVASREREPTVDFKTAGSIVTFGAYEQDNDLTNGKEPIEWIVLDVQDGRSLLISKYALDCQPYNTELTITTWETCSLRQWLNDGFLNAAFGIEEQLRIPVVTVTANNNIFNDTNPGKDTEDRVFILDYWDASSYFTSEEARICKPTAYARAQGCTAYGYGFCFWWLRSPGGSSVAATRIGTGGEIGVSGDPVSNDNYGVRPVIWVDWAS